MDVENIDVFQLGRRIASTRELRDLTQQELADQSGFSQATIARIEKGHKQQVAMNTIYRIAQVLDVDIGELARPIEGGREGRS